MMKPTLQRPSRWAGLVVFGALLALPMFAVLRYVFPGPPAEADIRSQASLAPFLVSPTDVVGISQDLDTDAVEFGYATSAEPKVFWETLSRSARDHGWTEVRTSDTNRRYERATGNGPVEVVDVKPDWTGSRVVVARSRRPK